MPKMFLEAGRPAFLSNTPSSSVADKEILGATVDKAAVAKAFSQAAATYNETAEIQQRISNHLLALLQKQLLQKQLSKNKSSEKNIAQAESLKPNDCTASGEGFSGEGAIDEMSGSGGAIDREPVVVDLGSGTGFSLPQLSEITASKQVIALDLSQAMLNAIPKSCKALPVAADFDDLPLAESAADVIFSSMSMQWSNNPKQLMRSLARVVKPNGLLAVSTLLEGSLSEIDIAWQKTDGSKRSLTHPSFDQWQSWVESMAIPLSFEQRQELQYFSTVKQLLKSVRAIGANDHRQDREKAFLGKRNYQAFLDALSSTAWDESTRSFKLSYSVLYAVLRKNKTA